MIRWVNLLDVQSTMVDQIFECLCQELKGDFFGKICVEHGRSLIYQHCANKCYDIGLHKCKTNTEQNTILLSFISLVK